MAAAGIGEGEYTVSASVSMNDDKFIAAEEEMVTNTESMSEEISTEFDDLAENISGSVDKIKEDVESLDEVDGTPKAELADSASDQVDGVASKVEGLDDVDGTAKAQLTDDISAKVTALKKDVEDLDSVDGEAKAQLLDDITTKLTALKKDIEALDDVDGEAKAQLIDDISAKVTALKKDVEALDDVDGKAKAQLTDDITEKTRVLKSEVEAFDDVVGTAKAKVDGTQAEAEVAKVTAEVEGLDTVEGTATLTTRTVDENGKPVEETHLTSTNDTAENATAIEEHNTQLDEGVDKEKDTQLVDHNDTGENELAIADHKTQLEEVPDVKVTNLLITVEKSSPTSTKKEEQSIGNQLAKALGSNLSELNPANIVSEIGTLTIGTLATTIGAGLATVIFNALAAGPGVSGIALALTGGTNAARKNFETKLGLIVTDFSKSINGGGPAPGSKSTGAGAIGGLLNTALTSFQTYLNNIKQPTLDMTSSLTLFLQTMDKIWTNPQNQEMLNQVGAFAAKSGQSWSKIIGDFTVGLGNMIEASEPLITEVLSILKGLSGQFSSTADFAKEQTFFSQLAANIKTMQPALAAFFGDLTQLIHTVINDLAIAGPGLLTLATAYVKVINTVLTIVGDFLKAFQGNSLLSAGAIAALLALKQVFQFVFSTVSDLLESIVKNKIKGALGNLGSSSSSSTASDTKQVDAANTQVKAAANMQRAVDTLNDKNKAADSAEETAAADQEAAATDTEATNTATKAADADTVIADSAEEAGSGGGILSKVLGLFGVGSAGGGLLGSLGLTAAAGGGLAAMFVGLDKLASVVGGNKGLKPISTGNNSNNGYGTASGSAFYTALAELEGSHGDKGESIYKLLGGQKSYLTSGEIGDLSKVQQALQDPKNKKLAKSAAQSILDGFNEIINGDKTTAKALQSNMNAVIKAANTELGIKSPSTVFKTVGQFVLSGFSAGVSDASWWSQIKSDFTSHLNTLVGDLKSTYGKQFKSLGGTWMTDLSDGITNGQQAVVAAATAVGKAAGTAAGQAYSAALASSMQSASAQAAISSAVNNALNSMAHTATSAIRTL